MAYNLATIRANLKTLLQTVTQISFVYDFFQPTVEGYPAIIFDITNNESEMLTDAENLRTITFSVYILAEIKTATLTGAKDLLDAATKAVVEALEDIDNLTLTNSVDWIMPTVGPREQSQTPEGAVLSQRLDIQVKVSSSIV